MLQLAFLMALGLPSTVSGEARDGVGADNTKAFNIPLRISSHQTVATPKGWPATTGVPFENGQLHEAQFQNLRVLGPAGQALPAQFQGRQPESLTILEWQEIRTFLRTGEGEG